MKLIPAFFILFSFAFWGCHKKEESKVTYAKIDEGLKKAFNFKQGSYWIYRDSLTGRIDSFITVANYLDSTAYVKGGYKESLPAYNIKIYISEFNLLSPSGEVSKWEWQLVSNKVFLNLITQYGQEYADQLFDFPLVKGMKGFGPAGEYLCVDSFTSFALLGNTHNNVFELHHFNRSSSVIDDWFFINNDVGIIKMRAVCLDSVYHVWELQRSHIVK